MKRFVCLLLPLFAFFGIRAQTLNECQQAAERNYPLIKRMDLIRQTTDLTMSNIQKGWLPQLSATAQSTYQSDVTAFPEQMQTLYKQMGISMEGLRKDQYRVGIDVQQLVFDGGAIKNQKAMAVENENVIEVQHLVKAFGSFRAVDDISFSVKRGEIFGFLGANGAGKTTAMHILTGLHQPTSGTGTVVGYDIRTEHEQIKKHIGYMSQKFSLYEDLTVAENIRLFAGIYGMKDIEIARKTDELLSRLNFAEHKNDLVSSLPLGWKQKLAFSVSIFHEPGVVFLDEPTGGVDPATRRQFWELIYDASARGITVFVTTHYMDEAEYCDRISIMVDGKISALGTPDELKQRFHQPDMNHVFTYLARQATRSSD